MPDSEDDVSVLMEEIPLEMSKESPYRLLFEQSALTPDDVERFRQELRRAVDDAPSLAAAVSELQNAFRDEFQRQGADAFLSVHRQLASLIETTPKAGGRAQVASAGTALVYVNGIWNTAPEFEANLLLFERFVEQSELRGVLVEGVYNPTPEAFCPTPVQLAQAVATAFDLRGAANLIFLFCDSLPLGRDLAAAFLARVLEEDQGVDAERLVARINFHLEQCRRVIVVAHSDGNHVTRDALRRLPLEVRDRVGVVMVGAPIGPTSMDSEHVDWIGAIADVVAWLGLDEVTCLDCCEAAEQFGVVVAELVARGVADERLLEDFAAASSRVALACQPALYVNGLGHSENGHPFGTYLAGSATGAAIRSAIAEQTRSLSGGTGGVRLLSRSVQLRNSFVPGQPPQFVVDPTSAVPPEEFPNPAFFGCDELRFDSLRVSPCDGYVQYLFTPADDSLPPDCTGADEVLTQMFYSARVEEGGFLAIEAAYGHDSSLNPTSDTASIAIGPGVAGYAVDFTNGRANGCSGLEDLESNLECFEGDSAWFLTLSYQDLLAPRYSARVGNGHLEVDITVSLSSSRAGITQMQQGLNTFSFSIATR